MTREEKKEYNRKYYAENREKRNEQDRKYHAENREKMNTYQIKSRIKKQIGEAPPPELVEVKLLVYKIKKQLKAV